MEQTNQSYLAAESLGKLMGKYAVPCIISLLVGALCLVISGPITDAVGISLLALVLLAQRVRLKKASTV